MKKTVLKKKRKIRIDPVIGTAICTSPIISNPVVEGAMNEAERQFKFYVFVGKVHCDTRVRSLFYCNYN